MNLLIAYLIGILTGAKKHNQKCSDGKSDSKNEGHSYPHHGVTSVEVRFPESAERERRAYQDKQHSTQKQLVIATWCTFAAVLIYAGITAAIWNANKKSAEAAKDSADATAKQLELTERPWVSIEMKVETGFIFDPNGARVGLKVTMKNIGHSPATALWPEAVMLPIEPSDILAERDKYCKEVMDREGKLTRAGYMLFPGEELEQHWMMSAKRKDVEQAANRSNGFIRPVIIACLPYRSTFNQSGYLTSKIRDFVWFPELTNPVPAYDIHVVEKGTIPLEHMGLRPHLVGANYAE
jgi:hypothetical protein